MYKFLVISLFLVSTNALPQGAPPSVCKTMTPFHGGGIAAQTDPTPFIVEPAARQIAEGTRLRVTLGSKQGLQFGGFMLQARNVDEEPIGTFVEIPDKNTKSTECSAPDDTVTHSNAGKKGPLEFIWQAPNDFLGEVVFKATVAQDYATFWVGFESPIVKIVKRSEITTIDFSTTSSNFKLTTTPPYYSTEIVGKPPTPDDPFYKGCFKEKGCFGAPEGCVKTKDCKAVVATMVRGDRYEFELQAPTDAKYVAVGLSDDAQMGDDSVVECVREGNGAKIYMSRTIPRPNLGVQRLAKPTAGLDMISYNITDGILYCKFRRDVKTVVNNQDYDLINQKFYLLIAAGTKLKGISAGFHDIAYLPTGESRYLTDVSEVAGASKILLRLHGAFMLTAWVGTASVGILLARYFRQTWIGSQICGKDQWFAWHRFFMICTWSLTMAGFTLIFVELKAWSSESNPHAILGLCTTVICFLQPIGAFFRPHPGTSRRPLFNWIHWLGGNVAHILAIVTIFFAVKLNKAELPEWMDWILVAFVAFHVCMHLIFSNSSMRKILLAVYLIIIILLVAAMVVVVVLAPFEETWSNLKKNVMQQ